MDVDPLQNLTNLKILRLPLHGQSVLFNIDGLAGLTNLTSLEVGWSVESLEPLRDLKNLRILSMENGGSADGSFQSLEPLSGLTQLESLEIRMRYQRDVDWSRYHRLQI